MTFHIACSTDDNYVQHCMAMLCSLLENNRQHDIVVHLLHHGLSNIGQKSIAELVKRYGKTIAIYDIDESYFENLTIADNHPNLSIATYYRLILPTILDAAIDRILYLDCDVIVLGDVKNLFELNLDGFGVAAVKDCTSGNNHRMVVSLPLDFTAFCAGVLMINLNYWRKNNCQENMLRFANEMRDRLFMEDQDVLNHEFRGRWFQLPYKFGYTPMSIVPIDINQTLEDVLEYAYKPVIIHYASFVKPWLNVSFPGRECYWKYARLSGFKNLKETEAKKSVRRMICKLKARCYLNRYVRPFVPDLIEIIVVDIVNIFALILGKKSSIQRWCEKYGMKIG